MNKSISRNFSCTRGFLAGLATMALGIAAACLSPAASATQITLAPVSTNAIATADTNSPVHLSVGDLNGDGKKDMAVAAGPYMSIWLGNGDGTFNLSTNVPLVGDATFSAIADVDGDGNTDVVAVNPTNDQLTIVFGSSTTNFLPVDLLLDAGSEPRQVVLDDLDFNGTNDIVVVNRGSNSVSVYTTADNGLSFDLLGSYAVGAQPIVAVGADLNGDGRTDIATLNAGDKTISILLGYGDGTFADASSFAIPGSANPLDMISGGVDSDSDTDLIVLLDNKKVVSFKNNSFASFSAGYTNTLGGNIAGLALGDFNGDGTSDIVVAGYNTPGTNVAILTGTGAGFTAATNLLTELNPTNVVVADITGDGLADLLVVNYGSNSVQAFVNQAPAAFAQSVTVLEDHSVDIYLTISNATFRYVNTNSPAHGTLSNVTSVATNLYRYTPATNYFGSDSFMFTVDNGASTSSAARVSITVTGVNDAPTLGLTTNLLTVLEDAATTNIYAFLTNATTGNIYENQALGFTLTADIPSLFSIPPSLTRTGTAARLTFKPNLSSNGTANITVVMHDTGGTNFGGVATTSTNFTIVITGVNDAPSFKVGTNVTVSEASGPVSIANWATNLLAGPMDEVAQTLRFTTNVTNPTLFSAQPSVAASGTLTFTPAADANGLSDVTLQLLDNGGTANGGTNGSKTAKFRITVRAVNNQPSFNFNPGYYVSGDPLVGALEDGGKVTILGFVTNTITGPTNETNQSYGFTTTNSNPNLFSSSPSINKANGALTFTPRGGSNGTAVVTLFLKDSGGVAFGGVDTYATNFIINVTNVNDAPTFAKKGNVTVLEDGGATNLQWATTIKAGPLDELSSQLVSFSLNVSNTALFSVQPAIDSSGLLSFTPAADANGYSDVRVQLVDDGDSLNGGTNGSVASVFRISVTAVDDAPSFSLTHDTIGNPLSLSKSAQTFLGFGSEITTYSIGPANEGSQTHTFTVLNNTNRFFFSTLPAVDQFGTLTFKTSTNSGSGSFQIRLSDNGSTSNGGVNAATNTFFFTIP